MRKISAFIKLTILLAGLSALFIAIGYYIGGEQGVYFAVIASLVMNFVSYWFSDKIVIGMSGAREASWKEVGGLEKSVQKICDDMNIPLPKLYIMDTLQANAFATGRNPKKGVVCLTTGIMHQLDRDQLLGVIAHELAHIKNYDILISSVAAVIVSAISSLQNLAFWFGFGGRDDEDRNPLVGLIVLITAPIVAMLLQFGISRSREYEADYTAAKYTKKPEALASALVAIDSSVRSTPIGDVNQSMASLFIHSPFSSRGLMELFSTHPLTEKRVERLMSIVLD